MCKRVIALSLLLLLSFCSTSWAATYQITEEQLSTLENNLNRLENLNSELTVNSEQSAKDLVKALYELKLLKEQLKALQTETQTAQSGLIEANKSLAIQSQSLKALEQREKKLKTERTIWQIVAIVAGVWGIAK